MSSWHGSVHSIHVAPAPGAAMESRDEVQAGAGRGLGGDRYASDARRAEDPSPEREVTLIEHEALRALQSEYDVVLAPGDSRRNIVTEGVPLNHLVGREFTIGDARLRGIELCEPCGSLQRRLGIPGLVHKLAHRGGLNAEIVSSGRIRTGDPIEPA